MRGTTNDDYTPVSPAGDSDDDIGLPANRGFLPLFAALGAILVASALVLHSQMTNPDCPLKGLHGLFV